MLKDPQRKIEIEHVWELFSLGHSILSQRNVPAKSLPSNDPHDFIIRFLLLDAMS
jgi:hypothetical protein